MSRHCRCGRKIDLIMDGSACALCQAKDKRHREVLEEQEAEREVIEEQTEALERAAEEALEAAEEEGRSTREAIREASERSASAAVRAAYLNNNPGDYECPNCGRISLKRPFSVCPQCQRNVPADYWDKVREREIKEAEKRAIENENTERERRKYEKMAAERRAIEDVNTERARQEREALNSRLLWILVVVLALVIAGIKIHDAFETPYNRILLKNDCPQEIQVVVSYFVPADGWVTQGWWIVPPRQSIETGIKSNGSKVFFYAHSDDGSEWVGENGNERSLEISDNSMSIRGGEHLQNGDVRRVNFFGVDVETPSSDVEPVFSCQK